MLITNTEEIAGFSLLGVGHGSLVSGTAVLVLRIAAGGNTAVGRTVGGFPAGSTADSAGHTAAGLAGRTADGLAAGTLAEMIDYFRPAEGVEVYMAAAGCIVGRAAGYIADHTADFEVEDVEGLECA